MFRWLPPIALLWALCGFAYAGVNHDPNLKWQTIESEHFRIHFHDGGADVAQRLWPLAEQNYRELSAFINWSPLDKTDVVLTDEYDYSNGYTRVFPYNSIILYISAPDEINSLEDYDDWLRLVFRHEYLHVVHLDKVRGVPDGFQSVFGRNPLLFPNAYQPRWVIEGLATYVETDRQKGIGRGQSSYFDMLMRMETLSGFKQIRRVNQPIASWPAGNVPYLYGVFFFEFVQERYGEAALLQLVENYSDNIIPFRINSNSASVFQKELPAMWDEYAQWLQHKYTSVADKIKQAGPREGRQLTNEGYRAGPLQTLDDAVYYYEFNGSTHAAVKLVAADGTAKKLLEVNPGARFDVSRQNGLLIAQPEICRNARVYYDIYRADLDGGNRKRLTHCARFRHAFWSGQGDQIIAVHNEMGESRLQLLNANAEVIETLWQGQDNEQIESVTSSVHQPYFVASIWRPVLGWNLEKFDLQRRQWTPLTHDQAIESQPRFSTDGRSILYSADSDGVYNIYQYELQTGTTMKLTNVLGGAFYPAELSDGLAYIGYSVHGFDVYALTASKPDPAAAIATATPESDDQAKSQPSASAATEQVQFAAADTAPLVKTDAAATPGLPATPYSPWSSLRPRYWMPYFSVDDQRSELGLTTTGNDVLERHFYSATLAYDFTNDVALGSLNYIYDGLWPVLHVGISRENDLYLDSNNNLARIRASDQGIAEAIVPFLSYDSNTLFHLALIKELHSDIWTKGIPPAADTENNLVATALRYYSAKSYPLSISRSEGRDLRLIYEDSDVIGDSVNKGQITVAEWREFLHLGHEHVMALRWTEGRGQNNPTRFRLGGIQDEDTFLTALQDGEIDALFNKRDYPLRGYSEGLAELIGKNMRLLSAEYRFPIRRIEHGWMVPPFGFNQIFGTVFYDVGGTWENSSGPDKYYAGTGVEFNADLDIFYNFRLRTTLGYAVGLDDTLGENKVYLRIGSQF